MTDRPDDRPAGPADPADDRLDIDGLADEPGSGSRRRDRRLLRWLLVTVVAVVLALYAAGWANARDRLPQETEIAGVDVGGLRPAAAERRLGEALAGRLDDPVRLVAGEQEVTIDPEEAGLDVDVPASVDQVPVGRSWNPADLWETFVGGESYDAVVVTVDDLLTEKLTEVADQVGEEPVEGAVRFTRRGAQPTYPRAGTTLDVDAAAETVAAAYPLQGPGDSVELELVADEPTVTRAEVARAMEEFANPAMSAPVTAVVAGREIVLRPAQYAGALSMAAEDGELVPRVDEQRLLAALRPGMRGIMTWPKNATIRIVDGRPRVIGSRDGIGIEREKLTAWFQRLVVAPEGQRRGQLPTVVRRPELTTWGARNLGVREVVSEFTTYYPHADYRNVNIGRAAELIDGTLLLPGETFSMNETVGERTAENGFTAGTIISNGVFKEELGGGVSQVATTTFNAAFFAGLEDVEHKPHSFYIDRYPVGREATVAWPVVDLRFRNDTDHGVLIDTAHSPSSPGGQGAVTVRMWSTKVWDIDSVTSERYAFTEPETRVLTGEECIPHDGYGGFQIDVTRVFRRAGQSEVVRREVMHTTYTPSDSVVCR